MVVQEYGHLVLEVAVVVSWVLLVKSALPATSEWYVLVSLVSARLMLLLRC